VQSDSVTISLTHVASDLQEMVILKRRCESLESEVQSQKRLRHGLGEVFHQQGFEAGWTENQIGRLMLHMRQTASGPYDPQQNLQVAELLDPVVTAQRNTCEQWYGAAELCQNMQQAAANIANNEDAP